MGLLFIYGASPLPFVLRINYPWHQKSYVGLYLEGLGSWAAEVMDSDMHLNHTPTGKKNQTWATSLGSDNETLHPYFLLICTCISYDM